MASRPRQPAEPAANVSAFPSARLKMAAHLRATADRISRASDDEAGDVFILTMDSDGRIAVQWTPGPDGGTTLQMVGALTLVREQIMEAYDGCDCEDDGSVN